MPESPAPKRGFWAWLRGLFGGDRPEPSTRAATEDRLGAQESRVLGEFARQYGIQFRDPELLRLALTHRSYLSVTGRGAQSSNERLEFLGDSVLGLVTSDFLFRRHPDEHEGQLTKTKSLLVSKAILSRRALKMGLGRFVFLSHSEVESGGRQRLSILADAFESVLGAIYLDQGFEVTRTFIHKHLLAESDTIVADKRHTNYKSHLQEYVQSTYRTHPVYRIRSEYGPDHSKHFMVEVMVGRKMLGSGRGQNKKEAEQAAARDALEKVQTGRSPRPGDEEVREPRRSRRSERRHEEHDDEPLAAPQAAEPPRDRADEPESDEDEGRRRPRRRRRGGRGSREDDAADAAPEREDRPARSEAYEPEPHPEAEPEPEPEPAPRAEIPRPAAVAPEEEEGEDAGDEGDQEARIDEIEQALASFGRRGSKYGRRGRRR